MRIDPVFLVAPKPVVPSMPTRRAFLLAGSTFAVGVSFGGACGYAVGAGKSGEGGGEGKAKAKEEELPPTNDVELDELRRLAVKAPIEELVERRLVFIAALSIDYRKDEVLWRGVGRLCDEVLSRQDYPERRRTARSLAQVIEVGEPGLQALLGHKIKELRSIK